MDITIFLAQIWGPIMLAFGLGFLFSLSQYKRAYRDLEKSPLTILIFGMFAMAFGIVHIQLHNVWQTLPEIIISIFGWGLLIKGTVCVIFPAFADRVGNFALKTKLLPRAGWFALLLGVYLSWVGYLM